MPLAFINSPSRGRFPFASSIIAALVIVAGVVLLVSYHDSRSSRRSFYGEEEADGPSRAPGTE